jgi:hypothetical protein
MADQVRPIHTNKLPDESATGHWKWQAYRTPPGPNETIGWGATEGEAVSDLQNAEDGISRGPRPEPVRIG